MTTLGGLLSSLAALPRNPYLADVAQAVGSVPILWALLLFAPLLIVFALESRFVSSPLTWLRKPLALVLAAIVIATYCWVSWRYASTQWYFDHGEANVAQVSWYAWTGKPVYQAISGPEYYNNLFYGPYLYVFNALVLGLFGPSIVTSKLIGAACATASIVLAWVVFKRQVGSSVGVCAVGLMLTVFLAFHHLTFWARSESQLILLVLLGLFVATSRSRLAPVVMGVAIGISADLKPHAIAYFLPIVAVAINRAFGARELRIAAVAAMVAGLLPFALPNVSLAAYLRLVLLAAKGPLSVAAYFELLAWLAALVLPVCLLVLWSLLAAPRSAVDRIRSNKTLLVSTLIAGVVLLPPASRGGSGSWHVIPFIPVLIFVTNELLRTGVLVTSWQKSVAGDAVRSLLYSWVLCAVAVALWNARDVYWQTKASNESGDRGQAVIDDIQRIYDTYSDRYTILMGAAEPYWRTWYRVELVFKGLPIGLDNCALMDFQGSNAPAPDLPEFHAWLKAHTPPWKQTLWLVPEGHKPFLLSSFRTPDLRPWAPYDVYPQRFRDDFDRMFPVRLPRSRYFDLYTEAQTGVH